MEIEGYCNYLVYEDGRVFSKKSRKMLKPSDDGHGYMKVCLCNQGKVKTMKLHRLVALHYIPNPHNYPEVDHIDRDKSNNDISNLRWADRYMNTQNTGMQCDNKLGIKNISYCNTRHIYIYNKMIRGKITRKTFKTLEEAIEFKNSLI